MKLAAAEPTKQLAFADYPSIGINAPQDSLIPKVILNGRYDTFGIPISEHVSKIDLCLVAWIVSNCLIRRMDSLCVGIPSLHRDCDGGTGTPGHC